MISDSLFASLKLADRISEARLVQCEDPLRYARGAVSIFEPDSDSYKKYQLLILCVRMHVR